MATHSMAKRRLAGKTVMKKIHAELDGFDRFFKKAGLQTAPSKKKTPSFNATLIQTKGFSFNREEANAR